ncbi:MAG: band 7 protein [Coriobacteriia bacterium]|nr:band 7 protein [Coriobacteriia bacterium]
MAEIRNYPVLRHLRSEPSMQVVRYRKGAAVQRGRGLAFWFHPLSTAVAEVPMDDRQLTLTFQGVSLDFQEVYVQGVVTWRVIDPNVLVNRLDFHIALDSGRWASEPLQQVAGLLTRVSQEIALDWIAERRLADVLAEGVSALREKIAEGLVGEPGLAEMGLEVATVRISSVRPSSEMEKALQTPVREAIQQSADEALFHRRASAVEKERAIAENELQNQIELAKREEQLIDQQGANDRSKARDETEAERIRVEAGAEHKRISSQAEAESLRLIEGVRVEVEQQMMGIYRNLPREVMVGLALREFASKLDRIDHLNITPDLLSPLLGDLLGAATRRLEA